MIMPIRYKAAQNVGAPQEWRVGDGRSTHDEMVAAARAGVASVEHELLTREPREMRLLVQMLGQFDHLGPALRRLDIHFEYAGIGRDTQRGQARILRRLIAFQDDRRA